MKHRWSLVFLLTLLLTILLGMLRPPSPVTGIPPEVFWIQKYQWGADHDMVLLGDSRTYRGLSPAVMQETLPEYRIANFGFSGNGLIPPYLEASERLLDPLSTRKTLVVAISPIALTPRAAADNGFLEVHRRHFVEASLERIFGNALHFLRPYEVSDVFNALVGRGNGYYQVYHPDGWVASRTIPDNPMEGMKAYQKIFVNNMVSEALIDGLIQAVQDWSAKGIRVYGVRLPCSSEMIALENAKSGFDEKALGERFELAGGKWISYADGEYHSYDGSHLREDAARRLSQDLASVLRRDSEVEQAP